MEDKVTIQKENLLKAYNQSSEEQKALLENIFGKDMFQPKDVKERVKSLDDAIKELGEDHQYVKAYRGWMRISNTECKDVTAYLRLRIICAALNEGWKPTFSEGEFRYYPWFSICTKDECNNLNESGNDYSIAPLPSNYNASAGGGLVSCGANFLSSFSSSGVRMALRSEELAKYCGKQFVDIWVDFLVGCGNL